MFRWVCIRCVWCVWCVFDVCVVMCFYLRVPWWSQYIQGTLVSRSKSVWVRLDAMALKKAKKYLHIIGGKQEVCGKYLCLKGASVPSCKTLFTQFYLFCHVFSVCVVSIFPVYVLHSCVPVEDIFLVYVAFLCVLKTCDSKPMTLFCFSKHSFLTHKGIVCAHVFFLHA